MSHYTASELQALRHQPLAAQMKALSIGIYHSRIYQHLIHHLPLTELPELWLGAGALTQWVWNILHHQPDTQHVKDIDLLYFDADTRWESEDKIIRQVKACASDSSALPWPVDLKNVARIHLWYEERCGRPLPEPYKSLADSVSTWPFTASALAVRLCAPQHVEPEAIALDWIAPFGFDDVLQGLLRPNLVLATPEVCQEKARRWQAQWPQLTFVESAQFTSGSCYTRS